MTIKNTFILAHPPIIVPEVGKGEERKARKTIEGFEKVAKIIASIKPETIILSSPHATPYADYINISSGEFGEGSFWNFRVPEVKMKIPYDNELVKKISELAEEKNIPAGTLGEQDDELDHGVLVPLYYINKYYKDYKLVRIGLSGLSLTKHYEFGKIVQKASEELSRKSVYIASGDLSHKLLPEGPYGFAPEGPVYDKKIGEIIETADFSKLFEFSPDFIEKAADCGLRSFVIMAGVLDSKEVKSQLFSLEGPYGVGYATGQFEVIGENNNRKFDKIYEEKEIDRVKDLRKDSDPWVELARKSLETYIRTNEKLKLPTNLPEEMTNTKAGVFVTIYKHGQLRGCIGTIEPVKDSVAEEILENAISSGTRDPRFPRVEESELNELVYSVDVLGEAEPISSLDELDTSKYGLIVTSGVKRGLLLPNIEGVDTPEEQLKIVRRKAGIYPHDKQTLERFKVVRHK
ncbi:AmmeMemoRadiSam system protein A [Miniphocaeibacter halophilus]|uniref:AmmeMemoRadiSam system protein A n=1 Tax=Miniphocaeibacter halophilus TaxID=2931922 RepID=A0AC61N2X0_9FIRM|nr:AmmeMemoRadiSam system protein A [Miniphocaeibacter halophilus]QQK08876.1 AmmeMemoRadiSam system protein A [Miniphocaeibacter halophilus]